MAFETLLIKVKTAIFSSSSSSSPPLNPAAAAEKKKKKNNNSKSNGTVGVLAFEIAGVMAKLVSLWQFLSDKNMVRLRTESISLEGVRKIISNDEAFLISLACAETVENLRHLSHSVSRLCHRCRDPSLRSFRRLLRDFAASGRDPHSWLLTWKEMELKTSRKMERLVAATAALHREIDELSAMENALRKMMQSSEQQSSAVADLHQKILWRRQEVKFLKERSLWGRSFDAVGSLLARSVFTTLARTKLVFGLVGPPSSLSRSLSASATVHPSEQPPDAAESHLFDSGPLIGKKEQSSPPSAAAGLGGDGFDFFEANSRMLRRPPPETTLGAAALSVHYANLVIVMEKMIKSPMLVGAEARDDVYAMLPTSVRAALRARLRGVGFAATDPTLAAEWRGALSRILAWLTPLAHNMIKWQTDRSLEPPTSAAAAAAATGDGGGGGKTNVLLLQTLFFANKDKTEAAITELLVGLNYIWRFEREMTAKALFEYNFVNNNNNNNISNGLLSNNLHDREDYC